MQVNLSLRRCAARIRQIQTQLQAQGPMRPGSLSRQYYVCGKPGCRCTAPQHPQRHPYYQLNYTYGGKKTSKTIDKEILPRVRVELANYKKFRRLIQEWVGLALCLAQATDKLTLSKPK